MMSSDGKCREESSKLLDCLIRNCGQLIVPCIAPLDKALVARLHDNNAVVTGALESSGELERQLGRKPESAQGSRDNGCFGTHTDKRNQSLLLGAMRLETVHRLRCSAKLNNV